MSEFRIDPIPNSSADWTSRDGEGRKWNGKAIQTFVRDGIKKAEENSENKIGATYFDEETNTQFQFKTIEDKESWLSSKDASLVLGTDTIRVDSQATIEDLDEIRSGAALGATALQNVPSEYITETELSNKSYATQSYVDTKISDLVGSAPEALDTLAELSGALKNNKDIVTVLENSIATKANTSDLDNYALSSHDHGDLYYTESEVDSLLSSKSDSSHTHSQYLTEHQDISHLASKSEIPSLSGYATEDFVTTKIAEAELSGEEVDLTGYATKEDLTNLATKDEIPSLTGYATESWVTSQNYLTEHQDLSGKQDKITDLETIRTGAALGASALQSIPTEYVTETELSSKGYLTEHQDISGKQNVITDLETIRANASKGASALQSIPSEYITETELTSMNFAKKADLTGYTTDAEFTALTEIVSNKADSSALSDYSQVGHVHDQYLTEHQDISGKQNVISDLSEIRANALKGSTALQSVPSEYITETELSNKSYATQSYVDTKISDLVGSAPEALNTLEELSDALRDNKDIVTVLENSIASKANASDLDNYSLSGHDHGDLYYTESEVNTLLSGKSDSDHTHSQYLTEHQDISGKQDVISDLNTIRQNALKGSTALQSVPSEYVTESELNAKGYLTSHQDISGKQDVISDLADIRANAAKGASALQSVPSEYVTESELNAKGYLTSHQDISGKQDVISDLATIRSNAEKGATALQSVPSEYVTETELSAKSYATQSYVNTKISDLVGTAPETLNTLGELSDALRDNKDIVTVLENSIASKANSSDLANYAVSGHKHDDLYYTETEVNTLLAGKSDSDHTHSQYLTQHQDISGKQDVISDLSTIRANAAKGATALQSFIETDPIFSASVAANITESDVTNWNSKTSNTGTVTGIKMNGSTKGTSGVVDLGKVITEHQDISGKANVSDLNTHTGNTTIHVTSSDKSKWNSAESNAKTYADSLNTSMGARVNTIEGTLPKIEQRLTTVEDHTEFDASNKVLWIGTSIPAGDITHGNNGTTQSTTTDLGSNNYPKMVADALGFTLYNNARGSSFVCFYPPEEDGTANWAGASDWTEYQNETWKGFSLAASMAQVDEKFGPNGLNCPEWLVNQFKSYSYESLIIPYIDGTLASCDTVIIDHGYNDRAVIINQTSWYPGDGETQFAAGAGRSWLKTLQDPFEQTLTTESFFQSAWWADESVNSKKHYFNAMIFICKKIWAVNPKIKIIIGNYFAKKSNVFGAEFGNDKLGEFVCLANSAIANWLQVKCVNVADQTGIYNRNLAAGNDYSLFCPDGVHPHSDSTGHSNKIIAGVYINAIRGILYI